MKKALENIKYKVYKTFWMQSNIPNAIQRIQH